MEDLKNGWSAEKWAEDRRNTTCLKMVGEFLNRPDNVQFVTSPKVGQPAPTAGQLAPTALQCYPSACHPAPLCAQSFPSYVQTSRSAVVQPIPSTTGPLASHPLALPADPPTSLFLSFITTIQAT